MAGRAPRLALQYDPASNWRLACYAVVPLFLIYLVRISGALNPFDVTRTSMAAFINSRSCADASTSCERNTYDG
jgi:hypothetical protein